MPEEQQVAGNDGRGHLRHVLLQPVHTSGPRSLRIAWPRSDETFPVAALAARDDTIPPATIGELTQRWRDHP